MSNDDTVIAKALSAGLRRLLVAAFIHQQRVGSGTEDLASLNDALRREIARLAMRGKTHEGEDVELTAAVRNGLMLFVDAAYREASDGRDPRDPIQ